MTTRLLDSKVVVITGGSRGIGRAIAIESARHGADVVIDYWQANDSSYGRHAAAEEVAERVHELGQRAALVEGDVADPMTSQRLVEAAVGKFGRIDVLSVNAGICPFYDFLDTPLDVFRKTMDVNLTGAYYVTQAVAKSMKDRGRGGAIVATSSISALVGGGKQAHYTPTKAGIHSLMQSCAIALGPYGIRCNSVMPGTIATDLNREDLSAPDKLSYMKGRIPLGRLGAPDDVAKVVVFLASDLAAYVSGAALLVDGGLFVNLQ
jgi:L-rhamnose 1-dehydrogenase